MKIAVLALSLNEQYDAVCFDVLFQFDALLHLLGAENVALFSQHTPPDVRPGIAVGNETKFKNWCERHPDGVVIFHYCDSTNIFDDFLKGLKNQVVVRWHNNTPPWFNMNSNGQAIHAQSGYENIVSYIDRPQIRFWVNSEFTARQLRALGCDASRIDTVFPGTRFLTLDDSRTTPCPTADEKDGFDLLFVGRTVQHKGHLNAIAVANALRHLTGKRVTMHFAGKRDPSMHRFNHKLDEAVNNSAAQILFHGLVSSRTLSELFAKADTFLCVSEHEGFGLPVFEALYNDLPVVAWANTAFEELLEGHPFAFPYFDASVFAAAISTLHDRDARRFVLDAQQVVKARYTYPVLEAQLQHACNRLDKARQTPPEVSGPIASVEESDIAATLTHLKREIAQQFPQRDRALIHDSGDNLVSLLDLQQYRQHFEQQKAYRFAPLIPSDQRRVHIDPIEQSSRDAVFSGEALYWPQAAYDGCLLWGPYIGLQPGDYIASFRLVTTSPNGKGSVLLDVNSTSGILASRSLPLQKLAYGTSFELPFSVSNIKDWLEFRLTAKDGLEGDLTFHGVGLRSAKTSSAAAKRQVQRDIAFFPPQANGIDIDPTSLSIRTIRLRKTSPAHVLRHEETISLPAGHHILDVQLNAANNTAVEITVKVEDGSTLFADICYTHATFPVVPRFPLQVHSDRQRPIRLVITAEGPGAEEAEYSGTFVTTIPAKLPPFRPRYFPLPAFMLKRRAMNAMRQRQFELAALAFEQLARKRSLTSGEWVQYGHALKEIGDDLGAETAYCNAIDLSPGDLETCLHLAHLYLKIHRVEKARALFEGLLSSGSFVVPARNGLQHIASLATVPDNSNSEH